MRNRDFSALAASLLHGAQELLQSWYPQGRIVSGEFKIGDVHGSPGKSLSVNLKTGAWADFASPEQFSGSDLISLFAARDGITQAEAFDRLSGTAPVAVAVKPQQKDAGQIGLPPEAAGLPAWDRYGAPTAIYRYETTSEQIAFYVTRHERDGGRKQFCPWSWDTKAAAWVNKAWPGKRPLYNLPAIEGRLEAPILVVEGEKCADALSRITSSYVVTCWAGGAMADRHTDFSPLFGRKVLLWPDADEPGIGAMGRIAELLADRAAEIKILDVSGQPPGWDAADAIEGGMTNWRAIAAWAKSRVRVWMPQSTAEKQAAADTKVIDRAQLWEDLGLILSSTLVPVCNLDNICKILERWDVVRGRFWRDEFSKKICTDWNGDTREWSDSDDRMLTREIQSTLEMPKCSIETVHESVQLVAAQNIRNPLSDFLEKCGAQWDGVNRLQTWLPRVFACESTPYTQAVGRCWLISMVARALQPGCKVDTMPILEGGQGVGKSTALQVLGGQWFTECHESITSKDFFGVLNGKWLIEISEMHSFNRVEKERIKGIISCQVDRYRAPYGRNTTDYPRSCVFAGTTNRSDWNQDETGARRFWPVECGSSVDVTWLRENRAQLLGEAVKRFRAGESWWDVDRDLQEAECVKRLSQDTWQEELLRELDSSRAYTVRQILTEIIKVEMSKQDRRMELRVQECLRRLGWVSSVTKTSTRQSLRIWKFHVIR
jgi:predicted P-loop ATPase